MRDDKTVGNPARVRVATTTTLEFSGAITVQELRDYLADIPGTGKVRINTYAGDRPGEASSTKITVTH